MKRYEVTIRATVTKTITVEANNETEATELANEEFNINCDGNDESYKQDTLCVETVKH